MKADTTTAGLIWTDLLRFRTRIVGATMEWHSYDATLCGPVISWAYGPKRAVFIVGLLKAHYDKEDRWVTRCAQPFRRVFEKLNIVSIRKTRGEVIISHELDEVPGRREYIIHLDRTWRETLKLMHR